MGGMCGKEKPEDSEKMSRSSPLRNGPLKERSVTDCPCCILFLAHWALFIVVTIAGFQDGNYQKLYRPRDFRGSFCGVTNENFATATAPRDYTGFDNLIYMMNVSHSTESVVKAFMCDRNVEMVLEDILSPADLEDYRCTCCISPCASCTGAMSLPVMSSTSDVAAGASNSMADLTDFSRQTSLWSSGVSDILNEVSKYFVTTCTAGCDSTAGARPRTYNYVPAYDHQLHNAWDAIGRDNSANSLPLRDAMQTAFAFSALSEDDCPYEARFCVPFPGLEFTEIGLGYCTFQLAEEVLSHVGSAFTTIGADALAESATEDLGSYMGDILATVESGAFILVAVCGFVVGLLFLVLLRFVVGIIVWAAIWSITFVFALGGLLLIVKSSQCVSADFWDSTQATGVASAGAAQSLAEEGVDASSASDESFTGNGVDYRGVQSRTRMGTNCQRWEDQSPHSHGYGDAATVSRGNLVENYCRNPESEDGSSAIGIWCFTTDPEVRWELCTPVGQVLPDCPNGYVVGSEEARKVLQVLGYITWILGAFWIVFICFMRSRIQLAIALNKVACQFIIETPKVLLVPIVQVVVGIVYCLGWAFCAAFLLSQVPESWVPLQTNYATWAEAYGTNNETGACTSMYPPGFPYKSSGDPGDATNPCQANGYPAGETPKCWKCAPPRYAFDVRFAFAFFSFLWNNAFLIAIGQCVIAGAVGVWFFTPTAVGKRAAPSLRIGLKNAFVYHLGSLAFGSFILAVVQFIRYFCKYLQKQAEQQKNKVMALVLKILGYCIWCFEKCVKFLNKNAYIQVALSGTNFCSSARKAFNLIFRNMLRFGAVAMLSGIVHSIGVIFITVGTAVLAYFVLLGLHPEMTPVFPMLMFVAMGWLIARLFMNVFGLAVDANLQCFIAAEEMGGDAPDSAAFVPSGLTSIIPVADPTPRAAF